MLPLDSILQLSSGLSFLALAMAASAQRLPYGPEITLDLAKKIAAAAIAEAGKNSWNVAVAIVDDGGHLVYFERLDETQFGSVDIAIGKARTAAAFKRPTKALEDAINSGQNAILSFPNTLPREGGLPILSGGKVIGGIGVSGGKSSEDAQVAMAGVEALKK